MRKSAFLTSFLLALPFVFAVVDEKISEVGERLKTYAIIGTVVIVALIIIFFIIYRLIKRGGKKKEKNDKALSTVSGPKTMAGGVSNPGVPGYSNA